MKAILKKMSFIVIAAAIVLPAMAQDFTQPRDPAIQSQKIMTTGAVYNGTVYEPFSNATPAEQSYTPAKAPGGPRRGYDANGNWVPDGDDFGGGAETGESDQFPIGDAMMPLLAFALMFCGYVAIRRRRAVNG